MKNLAMAAVAAFVLSLGLGACHHDSTVRNDDMHHTGSMGVMNKTCLITGEPLEHDPKLVQYNGKTYGCCCGGCVKKFNAMSDADKAACIAKAK